MMNKNVWGKSLLINLISCNENIKDEEKIKFFVDRLCELIDMKKYGELILKRFGEGSLEGYSCIQFIETSSITIHFDEIYNRAFIDIFSCSDFDSQKALDFSSQFFEGKVKKSKIFIRR